MFEQAKPDWLDLAVAVIGAVLGWLAGFRKGKNSADSQR